MCCTATAATYYFSSSGNDANSGTNQVAPWKSLSKVYTKSISGDPFYPGDSILLKSGDEFEDVVFLYSGGTPSNRVTIGRYGFGADPIIYGDSPGVEWFSEGSHPGVYYASPQSPSTVNDVADVSGNWYTKVSQGTNTLANWLSSFQTNNWGFSFDRRTNIFVKTPDGNPPPQMRLFQYTAVKVVAPASYVTVENLDIRRSNSGIVSDGSDGVIIRNNSVQDTLSTAIRFGDCSFGEIASNSIARGGWTLIYLKTGGSNWVHHNSLSNAVGTILGIVKSGRELGGIALERGTNNIVEYNSIVNVGNSFLDYWLEVGSTVRYNYGYHSSGAAYPDGTGLKVHNNIFNVDGGNGFGGGHSHDPLLSPAPDAGPNLIFNNVLYGFTGYGIYSQTNQSEGIVFRNNLIVCTDPSVSMVKVATGIDIDYNVYWCTQGNPREWNWDKVKYTNLQSFVSISGQDSHSIFIDPKFASQAPITALDFRLLSDSPCINAGLSMVLSGLIPSDFEHKDYIGSSIPNGIYTDIGAFEFYEPQSKIAINSRLARASIINVAN